MPHRTSFSQRDSDKNQFALWLPHCILVAILFFFPWAFNFSRKLSSYWGREHGPCDRPSLKNRRWFKLVVGCQKESYWDHGEKRHRDPCYIIKEEEAIFLSPPFPFLSFSFFFSTDLMTDNLVPKNVKTIRIKFYASPTVVGKGNSLRFWESSSPAKTKKIWIDVDQSVIFARYWRDLLYHNVGVTVSFLMVDATAKKIFHCYIQVNGFG